MPRHLRITSSSSASDKSACDSAANCSPWVSPSSAWETRSWRQTPASGPSTAHPSGLGDGSDRRLLEKLRVHRARALAAVGSDDLDNIAVALAVAGTAPSCRLIIRAGEHEAIAKTRSLLPLNIIRDVTSIRPPTWSLSRSVSIPSGVVSERSDLFLEYTRGTFTPTHLEDGQHSHKSSPVQFH